MDKLATYDVKFFQRRKTKSSVELKQSHKKIKSAFPKKITPYYLSKNLNIIFVYGDNTLHRGKKGAAICRDSVNAYGFITKKYPNNNKESFFKSKEYFEIYQQELKKLMLALINHPEKTFLISRLGDGLANKYGIFKKVIEPQIKDDLLQFENVEFLW